MTCTLGPTRSAALGLRRRLASPPAFSPSPSALGPIRWYARANPASPPGPSDPSAPYVKIVEVSPRDGLQNEKGMIPTTTKVELIRRLQDEAGAACIEAGSFVSPKWVPQMADTAQLLRTMPRRAGVSYPILVPNQRGLTDLLALLDDERKQGQGQSNGSGSASQPTVPPTDEIAIFTAATEAFSQRNTNVSIAESLHRLASVTEQALARGLKVRGYISVVGGCPYEGAVDPKRVGDVARDLFQMGCYEVSLGDTVGVASPTSMLAVLDECARHQPVEAYAAHCHDTFGTGLANVLALVRAGVRTVDAAVGGLGGCPYSPGATGNIDTESVIYALHSEGYQTGMDLERTAEIGQWIADALGKPNASRAGRALLARRPAATRQAKL